MLNIIKALWVTFLMHWGFSLLFAFGVWYLWKRTHKEFMWSWRYPAVFATVFSVYTTCSTLFGAYQNQSLAVYQQQMQADAQVQADKFRTDQAGNNLQLKQEFLKVVEELLKNPTQITGEVKQKVFTTYAALFINGDTDKQVYRDNVASVYKCQKAFMEDALSALQSKRAAKSKAREACYGMSGTFYGREKLMGAEAEKKDDELIDSIAKSGRVPASTGDQPVTPESLKKSIEAQQAVIETISKIFE